MECYAVEGASVFLLDIGYAHTFLPEGNIMPGYSVRGGSGYAFSPPSSSGGSGGWTDDGTTVRLTNATDVVSIGSSTPVTDRKLSVYNTGTNLGVSVVTLVSTNNVIETFVSGEANLRWSVDGTGATKWGAGAGSALDTRLYRSAANTLTVDNGGGGDATLIVRKLGTTTARSDTVTRGANRVSRTVVAAGATNLLATDDIVLFDLTTAGGAQIPTLPDLATNRGLTVNVVRLYDVTAFTVTVTPLGADRISSPTGVAATLPILAGVSVVLHAPDVGTNWVVL